MTSFSVLEARISQGRFDIQRSEFPALGISDASARRWISGGLLIPRGNGSYEIAAPLIGGRTERQVERHRRRAIATQRGVDASILVGLSALVLHGVPLPRVPDEVELARRIRLKARRHAVLVSVWWGTTPENVDGSAVQSVAEAVVDVSIHHGSAMATACALAAKDAGKLHEDKLLAAVERYGSRRLALRVRQLPTRVFGHDLPTLQAC